MLSDNDGLATLRGLGQWQSMETESLRLLRQRRADLWSRLEAARAELKAQEAEIAQIDIGIRAMEGDNIIPPSGADASLRAVAHHARARNADLQQLTMKQLVMKALTEHYRTGATSNELLDFFSREWGRTDITRTSLSPQLSRLKGEEKIDLMGRVWMLRDKAEKIFGGQFPNENGEAEASPDAEGVAAPSDHEPSSSEQPTRDGSVPGQERG